MIRWGSTVHCMESIQHNKHPLQALAINESSKNYLDNATKKIILSEVFWDRIQGFLTLLKPIADAITQVEGDQQQLSTVMKVFHSLRELFSQEVEKAPVLKNEEGEMKGIIQKRKTFTVKPIHLSANLLDPNYRGCHLTSEESVSMKEWNDYIK